MTKRIAVCDIDGCLVDSSHRTAKYFDHKLEEYFAAVVDDTVIPQGQYFYRALYHDPSVHMLFVTSRGDWPNYRKTTLDQLRRYVGPKITNDQLLMRSHEVMSLSRMPDEVYKPWAVEQAGFSLSDIFIAFDDREVVVQMWRDRGITCYHTQKGLY